MKYKKENYVLINVELLKKDIYKRNVIINGDVSVPKTLEANAMNGNIFSNCKSNAKRNTAGFDFSKYEKIKENEYGITHKMYLEKLCKIFGLKEEKYVLKEIEQKEETTDADKDSQQASVNYCDKLNEISAKIDTMCELMRQMIDSWK